MKNTDIKSSRNVIILFCFMIFTTTLSAQKIRLKLGKIIINDIEVFSYNESSNVSGRYRSIYKLNTNDEVIFIKENNGGTTSGSNPEVDDFVTYNFLKEKIKVEIAGITLFRDEVAFMLKEGVFDLQGNLNSEKIILFKDKFDEKVSEKIMIRK